MNNIEIGKKAEDIAVNYLFSNGFTILERNWRFKRAEIDIIVMKDGILIFVEVKYRSTGDFGAPEMAVNQRKQELLLDAGAAYAEQIGHDWAVRFDIIAIQGKSFHLEHFEDAFFPKN